MKIIRYIDCACDEEYICEYHLKKHIKIAFITCIILGIIALIINLN